MICLSPTAKTFNDGGVVGQTEWTEVDSDVDTGCSMISMHSTVLKDSLFAHTARVYRWQYRVVISGSSAAIPGNF